MKIHILFAAMLMAGTTCAEAKVYRWVDEEGNVVYSQIPPSGSGKVEEITLPPEKKKAPDTNEVKAGKSGKESPSSENYDRKKLEAMDPVLRKRYCEKAKKSIEILEKAEPGSAFVNEKNEIMKLSEEEQAKWLEKAKEAERAYCGK